MADEVDNAQAHTEMHLAAAIRERASKAQELELRRTGTCINCDMAVVGNALYCTTDCRADWERRQPKRRA